MHTNVITRMHKTKVNEKTRVSYIVAVVLEGKTFFHLLFEKVLLNLNILLLKSRVYYTLKWRVGLGRVTLLCKQSHVILSPYSYCEYQNIVYCKMLVLLDFFVQYLPLEMCIFSYVLFFFPPSILKENKIEYVFSNS